jgi:hypothetical protein
MERIWMMRIIGKIKVKINKKQINKMKSNGSRNRVIIKIQSNRSKNNKPMKRRKK